MVNQKIKAVEGRGQVFTEHGYPLPECGRLCRNVMCAGCHNQRFVLIGFIGHPFECGHRFSANQQQTAVDLNLFDILR